MPARLATAAGSLPPLLVGWVPFSLKEGEYADDAFDLRRSLPLPAHYTNVRNAGTEIEWLAPVDFGEELSVQTRLVDLVAAPGPGGPGPVHLAGGAGAQPGRRDRGAAALDRRPLPRDAIGQHGGECIMARILDLTTASGAYGPRLLAEAGDDVVRIEAPPAMRCGG